MRRYLSETDRFKEFLVKEPHTDQISPRHRVKRQTIVCLLCIIRATLTRVRLKYYSLALLGRETKRQKVLGDLERKADDIASKACQATSVRD